MTSASIRKAQIPISCHFCNGNKIKWKCEECDIMMCNSCKDNIHERIKSTKDHEVLSYDKVGNDPSASTEVSSEIISSIFNSYTTTVPVHNLLCTDNDIVYILANNNKENLMKVKMLKASIRKILSLGEPIFDIAVNKKGELFFTLLSRVAESPIRMLLTTGEIQTVLDPKPLRFLALHLNKDDEFVCSLREQGSPFPLHDFSARQVVVFGSDYKRKMTFEFDPNGKRLFAYPGRIRTDSKNVIYIIDWLDKNLSGRIVAMERNGRLKFTFCRPTNFEIFKPMSIVVTPNDNIVICDYFNDALLALNSKGSIIAVQFVHEMNISSINALCIDSEGFLLIGCAENDNESGTIHAVKMTETI